MITRALIFTFAFAFLTSCSSKYGKVSYSEAPKFINVSAYDPKERQRSGRSYTPHNQTALKANGSRALIARCAKGYELDTKCADFLQGAERQGMKLGAYCFILAHISPTVQADRCLQGTPDPRDSPRLRCRHQELGGSDRGIHPTHQTTHRHRPHRLSRKQRRFAERTLICQR